MVILHWKLRIGFVRQLNFKKGMQTALLSPIIDKLFIEQILSIRIDLDVFL